MKWYGGIEAGGTKFNCIIANNPDQILDETRISTTTPEETLPEVISFFARVISRENITLTSLGVGSFGPIDLDPSSPGFGSITSTPKIAWRNSRLLPILKNSLNIPISFDTDVNAAALGEGKWGAAVGCDNFVYITIGTGIGGGAVVNGIPVHGLLHPEMGHLFIPHNLDVDPFSGCCPSHGDCIEGLASGTAILTRWGLPAEQLPSNHPAWKVEAKYLSILLANIVLTISPERIILGGGVMKATGLLDLVRYELVNVLNGYVQSEQILSKIEQYVQLPALGDKAGALGSIALAQTID
jgi:fructokinase